MGDKLSRKVPIITFHVAHKERALEMRSTRFFADHRLLAVIFLAATGFVVFKLYSHSPSETTKLLTLPGSDKGPRMLFKKPAEIAKVKVEVYMESQCPDTTNFLDSHLKPVWDSLKDYIDLDIIPYGKAKTLPNGDDFRFLCQHGDRECAVNQLMDCGIDKLKDPKAYFPYILCLQGRSLGDTESCSSEAHVAHSEMLECAKGKKGRKLHAEMGKRTELLSPKLHFVPWVLINGHPDSSAFNNLQRAVCNKIQDPKPEACL